MLASLSEILRLNRQLTRMLIARAGPFEVVAQTVTIMRKCKNSMYSASSRESVQIQAISRLRLKVTKECDQWRTLSYLRYDIIGNFRTHNSPCPHLFQRAVRF